MQEKKCRFQKVYTYQVWNVLFCLYIARTCIYIFQCKAILLASRDSLSDRGIAICIAKEGVGCFSYMPFLAYLYLIKTLGNTAYLCSDRITICPKTFAFQWVRHLYLGFLAFGMVSLRGVQGPHGGYTYIIYTLCNTRGFYFRQPLRVRYLCISRA